MSQKFGLEGHSNRMTADPDAGRAASTAPPKIILDDSFLGGHRSRMAADPDAGRVPKIVVDDSFYQIFANRRAAGNAERAAQGLPPLEDNSSLMSESQAKAEAEARANRRAAQSASLQAARHAPPPPSRGPLCRAAKAKLAERIASIDGFERHSRKCKVCRSPYVEQIEEAYIGWHPVEVISNYFQFDDSETLYRHIRAAGLDKLRRQNVRWVVEQFIEQWRNVKVTSSTVIRSIRALSCLDDKGRWTDLPKTHILRRAPDVTTDTGLPDGGLTSITDLSSHGHASSPQEQNVPLSAQRSEPMHRKGTALAAPNRMASSGVLTPEANIPENGGGRFSSFERSEPAHCQGTAFHLEPPRKAAVPNRMASSRVSTPEANVFENADVQFASSERSDLDSRDSGFSENESKGSRFSSSERSEPTRVSAKNSALPDNAVSESVASFERSEPAKGSSLATCHSSLPSNRVNTGN